MRRVAILAVLLLLPVFTLEDAGEAEDGIEALLATVDVSEWDNLFRESGVSFDLLPSAYLKALAAMDQPYAVSPQGLVRKLVLPAASAAAGRVALLLGIAVFAAALNGLSDRSGIGETARTAFRIAASGMVLTLGFTEIRNALELFSTAERVTEILLPPLVGFLTLSGMARTAILLPAAQTLFSGFVLKTVGTVVAPLAVVGGVLLVLDAGGSGRVSSVGKLLQHAAKWILGTVCSLYLIVTAVRSAAAVSADGLLMRTTKLAVGSIPSIGALMSDSVDVAYQCLRFVRSALGLTGCIVLTAVLIKPMLSTLLMRSALKMSALLSEPLAGKPYAELLHGMGETLHILLLAELSTAAMAAAILAPTFGAGGAV